MRIISSYENMEPLYAEVAWGLEQLGYLDKSTDKIVRFINEKEDHMVLLPLKQPHESLHRARFAAVCSELEHMGIIEHMDDLGKMIKEKRLAVAAQIARQAPPKKAARKARPGKAAARQA